MNFLHDEADDPFMSRHNLGPEFRKGSKSFIMNKHLISDFYNLEKHKRLEAKVGWPHYDGNYFDNFLYRHLNLFRFNIFFYWNLKKHEKRLMKHWFPALHVNSHFFDTKFFRFRREKHYWIKLSITQIFATFTTESSTWKYQTRLQKKDSKIFSL